MATVAAIGRPAETPLVIPVHRLINGRAKLRPRYLRKFSGVIWPETLSGFRGSGIEFRISDDVAEIRRSPGGKPIFTGLRRDAVNLVLTDTVPIHWDGGRALKGVATIVDGCHMCVIALRYAHGHRIPLLSTNTCVHELLHVFLQDIFVNRPSRLESEEREMRIDWYATRLWLFGHDAGVRNSAEAYLRRLQFVPPAWLASTDFESERRAAIPAEAPTLISTKLRSTTAPSLTRLCSPNKETRFAGSYSTAPNRETLGNQADSEQSRICHGIPGYERVFLECSKFLVTKWSGKLSFEHDYL